jgi:Mg2+-importing ATPase
LASTAALVAVALILPYVPAASLFGFVPLPAGVLIALCAITAAYFGTAEVAKRWLLRSRGLAPLVRPATPTAA